MLLKRQIEETSESGAHGEAAEGGLHCSRVHATLALVHENVFCVCIQLVPKLLMRNL